MKWTTGLAIVLSSFIFAAPSFAGSTTGLYDWCVNANGDTSTACNGAGSGGLSLTGATIDLSAFDQTLEPGSNNLGSITIDLGVGSNQYVAFYADYDLDFVAEGANQDYASVNGSLPAGYSYSVNDPGFPNGCTGITTPTGCLLFDEFANNALDDTNYEPVGSTSPTPCCDVAFALAVGGLNVELGGTGSVTFDISTTAPTSGFYIQQTNLDLGDSIYLSATVDINNPVTPPSGVPEPSTFALGLAILGVAFAGIRAKHVRA